jgi:ribosome-associated protein YbcJ (S4-like RNA binding protein)
VLFGALSKSGGSAKVTVSDDEIIVTPEPA